MSIDGSIQATIALSAYAESLIEGRRVLVFGDARGGLAERLVERGARLVHVYDPDPARVAEAATRNSARLVTVAPLLDAGLALRDGAFDVAIIENLSALLASGVTAPMKKLVRALSARGVALIATPNPDATERLVTSEQPEPGGLDYYALYDVVAAEFEHIRMVGQAPFVGYALADFSAGADPTPSFDTTFLPSGAEEPELFVAVASREPVALDEFLVVQLPLRALGRHDRRGRLEQALGAARRAEQTARERAAKLEAENLELTAQLRRRVPDGNRDAADAARAHELGQRLAEAERVLGERDRWIRELEARASAADERADDVAAALEEAEARERELTRQLADGQRRGSAVDPAALAGARGELSALRSELAERDAQLRALRADVAGRDSQLQTARAELQATRAELQATRAELEATRSEQAARDGNTQQAAQQLSTLRAEHAALREDYGALRGEHVAVRSQLDAARRELRDSEQATRGEQTRHASELSRLRDAVAAAEKATQALRFQLEAVQAQPSGGEEQAELEAELTRVEAQLVERAQHIRQLEKELADARRLGRELLGLVEDVRSGEELSGLKRKLDELAMLNVRREGELATAEWQLQALEARLAVPA